MREDQDSNMPHDEILNSVSTYYTGKLETHGTTHRGVDWNSTESQELRFAQLLTLHADPTQPFSINDYGCGYGAMVDYMARTGLNFTYTGYDISTAMVEAARKRCSEQTNTAFTDQLSRLPQADYTVASGIFSVKLQTDNEAWTAYILDTIEKLDAVSTRGFSFNALTSYSDADKMRPDLHYADPLFLFDLCKKRYSRHVALLHDYGLYEFTILVRKQL